MVLIEMPEDFRPEFSKTYNFTGQEFQIHVQYRGVFLNEETQLTDHYWAFKLMILDELIVAGPFRHPADGEELTREDIADNLAAFYGFDIHGLIAQSREERLKKTEENAQNWIEQQNKHFLDEIVQVCVQYVLRDASAEMARRLMEFQDYDILVSSFNEKLGWEVILDFAADPSRLYRFARKAGEKAVTYTTYVKAHVTHVNI